MLYQVKIVYPIKNQHITQPIVFTNQRKELEYSNELHKGID